MSYELDRSQFDSYGNYRGQRNSDGCLRCGTNKDVKEISGPGCWLHLCPLCLEERNEIRKVEEKYRLLRIKRREEPCKK